MKKAIIPVISLLTAIIGCIIVNINTTKSLSPLGNTSENYKVVTEEFGEEFSEFITDKAPVKIYVDGEKDSAKVVFGGKSISLTKNNPILNKITPVFDFIGKKAKNIVDNFTENTENNYGNDREREAIDDVVDSFINWYEDNN